MGTGCGEGMTTGKLDGTSLGQKHGTEGDMVARGFPKQNLGVRALPAPSQEREREENKIDICAQQ